MEIIKVYTQDVPAARFIGKKYGDADKVNGLFGAKWGEFFANDGFAPIEAAAGGADALHALYEDADAYIGLMRGMPDGQYEYWIGEFTPVGTPVPDGYESIDFGADKLAVGWVYGSDETGEIYAKEGDVIEKLKAAGIEVDGDRDGMFYAFERYQCPRFTTPDDKGNVILDLCFFAK